MRPDDRFNTPRDFLPFEMNGGGVSPDGSDVSGNRGFSPQATLSRGSSLSHVRFLTRSHWSWNTRYRAG